MSREVRFSVEGWKVEVSFAPRDSGLDRWAEDPSVTASPPKACVDLLPDHYA